MSNLAQPSALRVVVPVKSAYVLCIFRYAEFGISFVPGAHGSCLFLL